MKEKAAKLAWGAAGFVSLSVGVVGIVLPGLPTTVFLLITAYCFARSSDRLHDWLVEHPHFGEPIQLWRKHGAIPLRGKILAVVMMAAAVALTIYLKAPIWVLGLQVFILPPVALFIWTRPGGPRKPDASEESSSPNDPG